MNDIMGGQVDVICDQTVNVVGPLKGGKIKGYAVASKTKSPALPEPADRERGRPAADSSSTSGTGCSRPRARQADPRQARGRAANGAQGPEHQSAHGRSRRRARVRGPRDACRIAYASQVRDRQVEPDHQEVRGIRRVGIRRSKAGSRAERWPGSARRASRTSVAGPCETPRRKSAVHCFVRIRPETSGSRPPSLPTRRDGCEVGPDGLAERREERLRAEAREEPEALQLVLDRVLHLREAQLDAVGAQRVVELGERCPRR